MPDLSLFDLAPGWRLTSNDRQWILERKHGSKWRPLHFVATKKAVLERILREEGIPLGIWQGDFIAPWDWRRGKRLTAAKDEKRQPCLIKGNISRSGERIYHVQGGAYYSRTRITTSKGERWFCSEAEARAAGWRRSKR